MWFGATLVAPDVRYIDHRHPPEEVYIVLSEGEWYREGLGWHAPGIGGVVYNPPNVVHAMRSGPAALLALWLLPSDPPELRATPPDARAIGGSGLGSCPGADVDSWTSNSHFGPRTGLAQGQPPAIARIRRP